MGTVSTGSDEQLDRDALAALYEETFRNLGAGEDDVDLILVATISPDTQLPATAMFVQRQLGARSTTPGSMRRVRSRPRPSGRCSSGIRTMRC